MGRRDREARIALIGLALLLVVLYCTRANAVVSTTGVAVSYAGDATNSIFSYPDYLFQASDLVVTTTVAGVSTGYTLGALPGFTFTGTADIFGAFPAGGNVKFVDGSGNAAPPAVGAAVLITRQTQKTQLAAFVDNNPMPATVIEHAYDKLTLMAQEQSLFLGVSAGSPVAPGGSSSAACTAGQWEENSAPVAGGNFGWLCTTAGIAGAAVWSAFGLVSQ